MINKSMFKKLLISFLLAVFLLTSTSVSYVKADDNPWYDQSFQEWYAKVYDEETSQEIFGERYTAAQVQWVIYGLIAFIVNQTGDKEAQACLMSTNDIPGCTDKILNAAKKFLPPESPSESTSGSKLWQETFTMRPISAMAYLTDLGQRLKIVPEAQAQGFGFSAGNPVLGLWRVARNTTYLLLIIVIVVMAFMIMFRVKISPQTVITIQSALPKLILTLILITFSYAIAGFLIDIMYVVMGLIATLLSSGGAGVSDFDFSELFHALTNRSGLALTLSYFFAFAITSLPIMSRAMPPVFAIIVFFIVLIVLLIVAIRIMWLLLKTYVMILLQIILGPFQILLGAVSPVGFGAWLRNILANLAVYPTVGLMFILAFVFLAGALDAFLPDFLLRDELMRAIMPLNINPGFVGENNWDPPLTWGAGATGILFLGASFVIITLIPSAGDMIKSLVQGQPFTYGTALGQATGLARGIGATGTAAGGEFAIGKKFQRTRGEKPSAGERAAMAALEQVVSFIRGGRRQ